MENHHCVTSLTSIDCSQRFFAPYLQIIANIDGQPFFSATETTVLEGFGGRLILLKR